MRIDEIQVVFGARHAYPAGRAQELPALLLPSLGLDYQQGDLRRCRSDS